MHLLIPLAGLLGIEVEHLAERLKSRAIAYLAIALFGLIAFGFALAALTIWIAEELGALSAVLIVAGGALLIAVLLYVITTVLERRRVLKRSESKRSSDTTAFVTTAALTVLPMLLSNPTIRKVGLPIGALAALLLVGSKRDQDS